MMLSENMHNVADKFRILIVEDEMLVSLEMQIILNLAGFDVVGVANTISTALNIASTSAPQLAIVDLNLAGGDRGVDLVEKLNALEIPAIFSSGNCPKDICPVLAIGCLHKPFDDYALTQAVHMARAIVEQTERPKTLTSFQVYKSAQ